MKYKVLKNFLTIPKGAVIEVNFDNYTVKLGDYYIPTSQAAVVIFVIKEYKKANEIFKSLTKKENESKQHF